MNLLELLIDILAPLECLNCGNEGSLLCSSCDKHLPVAASHCYRCHTPTLNYEVCSTCSSNSSIRNVYVATVYSGVAKDILWQLKLAGVRSSAQLIASKLALLVSNKSNTLLVPVPTATSRARQRGYDQAELITRELSRITGMPRSRLLARSGQMHQHGLSREQRLRQLNNAYRTKNSSRVRGRHIILVDDVITTGATLESAAWVLRSAGAKTIDAAVFAQPLIRKTLPQ